jgi:hypothetical protein
MTDGVYSASFTAPTIVGIDGHSGTGGFEWKFPNGVTVTSKLGHSIDPLIINFTDASPNGAYYSFKQTDSEGASAIGRRLIFLYNSIDAETPRVLFGSIGGGYEVGGYSTQITIPKNADYLNIIDGAEAIITQDSRYGTSQLNINGNEVASARNILFRGWFSEESNNISPFSSETVLVLNTANQELDKTHAYDILLRNDGILENKWQDTASLTLNRAAAYLLKHRSTAAELVNFYRPTDLAQTEQIRFQALPRASIWQQLRANYGERGYLGFCSADMLSSIIPFQDVQISGASNSLITTTLTKRDIRDTISVYHPHRDANAQSRLYAISDEEPLAAESPGDVAGYYGGFQEIAQGLLVDGQDTLIKWSGNLRAKLNNKYPYSVIPLSGNYPLDSVPQSLVKTTLSPSDNSRGLDWRDKAFVTKETTMDYDGLSGYVNTTIAVEAMTRGIGGSKLEFPVVENPPPIDPPDWPGPDPNPNPDPSDGFGTVYAMTADYLGRTRDLSVSSPAWVSIGPPGVNNLNRFILDSWRPATTGFLTSNNGIWKSSNLHTASPTWTNVLSLAGTGISGANRFTYIVTSINVDNYVSAILRAGSGAPYRWYCCRSTDGGSTWSVHLITNSTLNSQIGHSFDYVPHLVGGQVRLFFGQVRQRSNWGASANRHESYCWRSDDGGITWTNLSIIATGSFNVSTARKLHCPYNGNTPGNLVYAAVHRTSGTGGLFYSSDSGVTWTHLVTGVDAANVGMGTYTQDKTIANMWTTANDLLFTTNEWASHTTKAKSGFTGTVISSGGFPFNSAQYYALSNDSGVLKIWVSINEGNSFIDKTGNWATAVGTGVSVGDIGATIVPLWIE